ncbi:hypothetical protein [Paenibacillus sp. MMS20-IR301]|uniref:hypothetical protein n=1 Tax=Paenibacillus sp. MMS20-IR301 TaxID=2895946 RepID=UPI0028EE15A3|nr:hypothetical protein [Paenibacillus sp. MMS20-IR301]WNS41859.1 hypothetical protein LOS79_23005 [Paenibacillus sp. MMS20-IR301]
MRSLQSGVVISLLFLCTSQQIGNTYGGFTDAAQLESEISFCAVFPETFKEQLIQFKGHVTAAVLLAASLKDYSFPQSYQGISSIESMSLTELDAAEQHLSEQLSELNSGLKQADIQLNANQQTWNELTAEINAAAAGLAVIGGYMNNLDPYCLEITDDQFFSEFQSSLSQSDVLSETLTASLNGIIQYLQSLHDPDTAYSLTVSDLVYGPLGFSQEAVSQRFIFPVTATLPEDNISGTLLSTYNSLNSSLLSLKDSAASSIAEIGSQQQLISETRSVRLEEEEQARLAEQAKKDEEAKQALEKQKAAEAKEKAEAEEKAAAKPEDGTKPEDTSADKPGEVTDLPDPAGSGQPEPAATPAPELTEATAQEPQATASPVPEPEPAPDLSNSQQDKGGD